MFYHDALIMHKLMDLNWSSGNKLHVAFPVKVLDKYLSKLVNLGYKVAVIE